MAIIASCLQSTHRLHTHVQLCQTALCILHLIVPIVPLVFSRLTIRNLLSILGALASRASSSFLFLLTLALLGNRLLLLGQWQSEWERDTLLEVLLRNPVCPRKLPDKTAFPELTLEGLEVRFNFHATQLIDLVSVALDSRLKNGDSLVQAQHIVAGAHRVTEEWQPSVVGLVLDRIIR